MRHLPTTAVLVLAVALPGFGQDREQGPGSPEAEYVAASAQPAVDYVVGLFADHDVVVVGEIHEVADNCRFVADVIDDAYHRGGVRVVASEFFRQSQTQAMAALVTAPSWDEAAAVELMRQCANVIWGYREYLDIYKAVWEVNQALTPGAEKMRLIGLDSEWNQLALLNEPSEAANFRIRLDRERCMIESLEAAIAAPGTKALAHVGFAHSITGHGERFATVLRRRHGERVFQVALHHNFPGPGETSPFTQRLETLLRDRGPVGITIEGSPLAEWRREDCYYFKMLGKGASLEDAAEGYVFLAPVAELRPVSWIDGFITEETFSEAREVARRMSRLGHEEDCPDAAALNAVLRRRLEERGAGPG